MLKSLTLQEMKIGDEATFVKTFTEAMVKEYAQLTGDANPAHIDPEYAASTPFQRPIVHGMLVGAMYSTIFGCTLPGLGSIYTKQSLKFIKPVFLGDTITAKVCVTLLIPEKNRVIFSCESVNQHQEVVMVGEAEIMPPKARVSE
ncbi:MAG: MaoC family dehydratase [Acholeplasmataceae bacterium]|nr:MaoC family dehydratase [Acholeplasmataceae bacterium]